MVKNIYGKTCLDNKCNVFVKSVSAGENGMHEELYNSYCRAEPDAIVIHGSTNDLKRQEQPEEIACEIANLASSFKSKKK